MGDPRVPRIPVALSAPSLNRGVGFTHEERRKLGLTGRLPSAVLTLEQQADRVWHQLQGMATDLGRNLLLEQLHYRHELLYYRVLSDHLPELMPVVYTPTVGEAIQRFSDEYRGQRAPAKQVQRRQSHVLQDLRLHGRVHLLHERHIDQVEEVEQSDPCDSKDQVKPAQEQLSSFRSSMGRHNQRDSGEVGHRWTQVCTFAAGAVNCKLLAGKATPPGEWASYGASSELKRNALRAYRTPIGLLGRL